jgi:hypothetical protein
VLIGLAREFHAKNGNYSTFTTTEATWLNICEVVLADIPPDDATMERIEKWKSSNVENVLNVGNVENERLERAVGDRTSAAIEQAQRSSTPTLRNHTSPLAMFLIGNRQLRIKIPPQRLPLSKPAIAHDILVLARAITPTVKVTRLPHKHSW